MSNMVNQMRCLTICFILDLQDNIYTFAVYCHYMDGEAGRGMVVFLCVFSCSFQKVQHQNIARYCIDRMHSSWRAILY